MFVRFTTDQFDDIPDQRIGVFTVAYKLVKGGNLLDYQSDELRTTLDWFEEHLAVPKRFSRSRRPHRESKGICWFKATATDCMTQVRYLVQLVSAHDVLIQELTTIRPGYIIYEDEHQVVAEPFYETPR